MWPLWTLLLTFLCTGIAYFWLKSHKFWAKYQHLPGPKTLPILGNVLEFVKNDFDVLKTVMDFADRYKGFFVMYIAQRPVVVLSDPEHLKIFYTSTTLLDRGPIYRYVADPIGDTIFFANGATWKKSRKMLNVNFVRTPPETWKRNFQDVAERTLADLRKKTNGPAFQCYKLLRMATTDAIVLNITGENLNSVEKQEAICDCAEYVLRVAHLRNFNIFLQYNFTFNLLPIGRRFWSRIAEMRTLVRQIWRKKEQEMKEMEKKGETLPDLCIFNMPKNNPEMSVEMMVNEYLTLAVASLDTTAGTMGFVLICLGLFPDVQEKVYQEDRKVHSLLAGRQLEVDDLQNYTYLERVIKETLRIFPVAPILGREASEDIHIGNHLVPKGTEVLALQMFTNHNPQIFADPFRFDPDRFLPENMEKLPPYAFNPFSAGPRNCPGARYAYISMKITLTSIVREFRIATTYSSLEEANRNTEAEFTLRDKNGFPIRLETRE